jgi:hypothetical protein
VRNDSEKEDMERRKKEDFDATPLNETDEEKLKDSLKKLYRKKDLKEKKNEVTKETDPRKLAWLKKQDELNERSKYEQEEERQHQTHSTDIDNYRALTELLESSKGGKTTAEMNKLIPSVYRAFGKNVGTNTNRKVSTVINQLKMWQAEKDSKAEKIAAYNAQLSAKKAKAQKAKVDDSKRRLPPKSSSGEQGEKNTIEALSNMDVNNKNKTRLEMKNVLPPEPEPEPLELYVVRPKNKNKATSQTDTSQTGGGGKAIVTSKTGGSGNKRK